MQITRRVSAAFGAAGPSEDDQLALDARGDIGAFARLYDRHVNRVFRYLRARGADGEEAADLAALTFERALRNLARFRPGGSGFGPWVLTIARNAHIDAGRRRHGTVDLAEADQLPADGRSPEEAAIAAEESRWIRCLVRKLPEAQRDALALRYAGGLSSREIAAVLGKSEAATRKLLSRSLATLREESSHDA